MRGLFTVGNLCSPAGVQMAVAVPAGHALVRWQWWVRHTGPNGDT